MEEIEKLKKVHSIIINMFYEAENLYQDGEVEKSDLLEKYRKRLSNATQFPTEMTAEFKKDFAESSEED